MKNEYQVTWKRYLSWIMEGKFRGIRLLLVFMWCLIACTCVFAAFVVGIKGFFFLVALFCVYRAFFRDILIGRRQYGLLVKHHKSKDWRRVIEFADDGIHLYEENSSLKFEYDRIKDIREKGDQISLYMDDRTTIRLYHSAFTEGDWNGCKRMMDAYLEEKENLIRQERGENPERFRQEKTDLEERLRKRISLMVLGIFLFVVCVAVTVILNIAVSDGRGVDFSQITTVDCEITRVASHKIKTSTIYDYYTIYQGEECEVHTSQYNLKKGMQVRVYVYKGKLYADRTSIKTNNGLAGIYYAMLVVDCAAFYFMALMIAYVKQDRKKRKELEQSRTTGK